MLKGLKNNLFGFLATLLLGLGFVISAQAEVTFNSVVLNGGTNATREVSTPVHNALPVTVRLKLRRDGSDNNFAQRSVRIRLTSGNGNFTETVRPIGGAEETFTLNLPKAGGANDCRTWSVRLSNAENANNAEVNQAVRGSIEFYTTGSQIVTIAAPAKFGIVQSGEVFKNINVPFTGDMTIQANWDTDEFSPVNFQLRFELYNTHGQLVDSDVGYSRDSFIIGVSDSQRMKITYRAKCSDFGGSQSWKIRVKGSTSGKVKNVDLKMKIHDGLF